MMMFKQLMMTAPKQYNALSLLSTRAFTSRVFVEGLPSEWTHHEIAQRFSIAGTVQKVNLVKNSIGQNTGKAIVTFE